jgi:hypothetical protein
MAGTAPPVVKEEPRVRSPHVHAAPHHPPKPQHPTEVSGLQGRVVSSYREGAMTVLHLDKGSAAGIQVGQTGWVLDGPTGATPLDGGSFTVVQVVDEMRSIARTSLHSLGRNTRVSINTGR